MQVNFQNFGSTWAKRIPSKQEPYQNDKPYPKLRNQANHSLKVEPYYGHLGLIRSSNCSKNCNTQNAAVSKAMAALTCHLQPSNYYAKRTPISCTMQQPSQSNIKVIPHCSFQLFLFHETFSRHFLAHTIASQVIVNGAAKEIGRAAVIAVTRARGMEVAGAVDNYAVGEDIGKVCRMSSSLRLSLKIDPTRKSTRKYQVLNQIS